MSNEVSRLSSIRVFGSNGDFVIPSNFQDILAPIRRFGGTEKVKVLDVGCNSTWLAEFFTDYYGVDTDAHLIDWARNRWINKARMTRDEAISRLKVSESETLPFESNQFDWVILRDVLEHVDDPFRLYSEAIRCLKPGGHVYLSCPDAQGHVWNEPSHRRPFPIRAQRQLADTHHSKTVYAGYESVAPGTQKLAKLFFGRTPAIIRMLWSFWFWPRNAVTICQKH